MKTQTLEDIMWHEYDNAARDLARKGLKGDIGDPLPLNMCKAACDLIDADPEAFQKRVRAFAYGESMDRLNLPEDAS